MNIMKFFLALISVPLLFTACFGVSPDPADEKASEDNRDVEKSAEETTNEASPEKEQAPTEIKPVNVTSPAFVSTFFNGSYEYRTVSVHSSYDYMVDTLGEPTGNGRTVDGTYYHYDHIGFNFPSSADDAENLSELKVDGIIIFPKDFYKSEAVETFGWPTVDETSEFRMIYDSDTDNGYYVMLNYTEQDQISEIIIQFKNLSDTKFYKQKDD